MTAKRLAVGDIRHPFHGVNVHAPADPAPDGEDSFGVRARAQRAVILEAARFYALRAAPHEFFSHSTAAMLWGIPLPMRPDEQPHVAVLAPVRIPRAAGIHGHQAQPAMTRVVVHPETGLRVASPATTWAMLGGELRDLYDLVAAADFLVRVPRMPAGLPFRAGERTRPLATIAQLEAALFSGRRVGKPALREALPLVRTGSSSRRETWVRLTIVDAGLPEPELDVDVFDDDGVFVGCLDLAYPGLKVGIEYEGDQHRTDPDQWQRDIEKHDRLMALGWRIIRVSRAQLSGDRRELARRVSDALRAAA